MATASLVRAVQAALKGAPVSLRELARRAGTSHSLLVLLLAGKRQPTADVAGRLIAALDVLASEAAKSAKAIHRALPKDPP